ncbi:hypothetical protein NDU88_000977 [Pleurodeles waltl]|uniref:Uncharacterized protein n=1 Tax=Pleurodeles waltl TaxID=8319 RepID=A0AAV7TGB2_PLEWA|nr:hypothetical protein NDU88_000977 [Pleurodeles waltl]
MPQRQKRGLKKAAPLRTPYSYPGRPGSRLKGHQEQRRTSSKDSRRRRILTTQPGIPRAAKQQLRTHRGRRYLAGPSGAAEDRRTPQEAEEFG